jgi:hypothetical protein
MEEIVKYLIVSCGQSFNYFLEQENENWYFNEIIDRYEECYDSCKTCFEVGNSTFHNCLTWYHNI